jgi:oxalate decarboxylase/phosphoglucose isomerase-like protein (cupin superfamily)
MVELRGWTDGMGSEPHTHTNEDEAWYVLEGELSLEVGHSKIVAPQGSFVLGPKGVQHIFKVSKRPASFLLMYWPAGFEKLFIEREALRQRYGITYNQADGRNEPSDPEYWAATEALPRKYGVINRYTEHA